MVYILFSTRTAHNDYWLSIRTSRKLQRRAVELEQAIDKAERANRSKDLFLANMSHEIRTPLNAIVGMSYLLSQSELAKEQHEYCHHLSNSSELLLKIINDVLDISKMEHGSIELTPARHNLHELVLHPVNTASNSG